MCRSCRKSVVLHDGLGTYVQINECPYHNVDYTQEMRMMEWYLDYANGHNPFDIPRSRWKYWIKQGFDVLSNCSTIDAERKKAKTNKQRGI